MLNDASDELMSALAPIEHGLQKLNLGIETWVKVKDLDVDEEEPAFYHTLKLGYAYTSRWGIALRMSKGHGEVAGSHSEQTWLFGDAPRAFRIDAVEKLPSLFDRMSKKSETTARNIKSVTHMAREFAAGVEQALAEAYPKKRIIIAKPTGEAR